MRLLINNLEIVIIVDTGNQHLALGWLESKGIFNPFTCPMDGKYAEVGICVPISMIPPQLLVTLVKRVTGIVFKVSEVGGDNPQAVDMQDSPQAVPAPDAPPAPVVPQPPEPVIESEQLPALYDEHYMDESLLVQHGYTRILPDVEYNPIELADCLSKLTGYNVEYIAAPQLSVVPESMPETGATQPEAEVSIPKKGRVSKSSIIKLLSRKDAETIEKLRDDYGIPLTATKQSAIAIIAECLLGLDNSEREAVLAS